MHAKWRSPLSPVRWSADGTTAIPRSPWRMSQPCAGRPGRHRRGVPEAQPGLWRRLPLAGTGLPLSGPGPGLLRATACVVEGVGHRGRIATASLNEKSRDLREVAQGLQSSSPQFPLRIARNDGRGNVGKWSRRSIRNAVGTVALRPADLALLPDGRCYVACNRRQLRARSHRPGPSVRARFRTPSCLEVHNEGLLTLATSLWRC